MNNQNNSFDYEEQKESVQDFSEKQFGNKLVITENSTELSMPKIENKEDFGKYLFFSHKLEKWSKELKSYVKKKSIDFMDEKVLEFDDFVIIDKNDSETLEYNVQAVVDSLGWERARALMKVNNTKLHMYFKMGLPSGAVTYKEVDDCRLGAKKTRKAGGIMIKEKKSNKLI